MATTLKVDYISLADGDTRDLDASTRAFGIAILGDCWAFARFRCKADATVSLDASDGFRTKTVSANPGTFNIFDAGGNILRFENLSGATKDLLVIYQECDNTDALADNGKTAVTAVGQQALGITMWDDAAGMQYWLNDSDAYIYPIGASPNCAWTNIDGRYIVRRDVVLSQDFVNNRSGAVSYYNVEINEGAAVVLADGGSFVGNVTEPGHGYAFIAEMTDAGAPAGFVAFIEFFFDSDGNVTSIWSRNAAWGASTAGTLSVYRSGAGAITFENNTGLQHTVNWFTEVASDYTIADTEARAEPWNSTTVNNVLVGWEKPSEAYYAHSYAYRDRNGAGEQYLKDDGTWAAAGTKYKFESGATDGGKFLAFIDTDVADGEYTYRITHVASGGVTESTGTSFKAYVGAPAATASLVFPTAATSEFKDVEISVANDSGATAGADSGMAYSFKIQQAGGDWITIKPNGADPVVVYMRVQGGAGLKQFNIKGVDQCGQEGATDSVSFTYAPVTTQPTWDTDENLMLGYRISSDSRTFACVQTAATSDVDNLKDPRFGVSWKGQTIDDLAGPALHAQYLITCTFAQAVTIDLAFLDYHNLTDSDLSDASVYFLASNDAAAAGWNAVNWLINAAYNVNVSDYLSRSIICTRPESSYKYWAVILHPTAVDATAAASFIPRVGRIGFIKNGNIWQPTMQFESGYRASVKDQSLVAQSEAMALESVEFAKRGAYRFGFKFSDRADYLSLRDIFKEYGTTEDMLVVPRPSDLPTGTTQPDSDDEWTIDPFVCQIDGDYTLTGFSAQLGDYTLNVKEVIGAEDD